ncbi:MAG: hypothetical protein QOI10_2622 [Solirubrobacterales bacterium]|jgi:hypothetical protein|nr:hypothetical protein [Solirubrobacterales bacterium]
MRWRKLGLVPGADGSRPWASHSALQPTPLLLGETIRLFVGFRDSAGRSSVAFIDVDAADPMRVVRVAEEPALERGAADAFDRDGVVPCAIVADGSRLRLYYAGYEQAVDVRFRVFGGLATSQDGGESFARLSDQPLTGPAPGETLFRVIHSIRREGDLWRAWYGAGDSFIDGRETTRPVYDIRYMESPDGISFPDRGRVVVPLGPAEHRVGRPYVVEGGPGYQMFFGGATDAQGYRLAYAESVDGLEWKRLDQEIGLDASPGGFDSRMIGYPAVVDVGPKRYLFYNGDDYGRAGVGVAVLE